MGTSDRKTYETSMTLTQATLDECQDALTCQLESIVDIETPDGSFIRASDRNKYVGNVFYEALLNFPTITRTLGDWLSTGIEFSELRLELSNADGRFSKYSPGGALHKSWIGLSVTVRVGLRDVESTYFIVFKGNISQVGGFGRTTGSITLAARDSFDRVARTFPVTIFGREVYPKIEDGVAGEFMPIIYGDWTTAFNPLVGASVPGIVVNGHDPLLEPSRNEEVLISVSNPVLLKLPYHCYSDGDAIQLDTDGSLPSPLVPNNDYFVSGAGTNDFSISNSRGGPAITTTGAQAGTHHIKPSPTVPIVYRNIQCVIANDPLALFDVKNISVKRGELAYLINPLDITGLVAANNAFEIKQNTGNTYIGVDKYIYASGDLFFCRVKGKSLGSYSDNIVWQARDILITYGRLTTTDFDANWETFRDAVTPAQSAIFLIKSRIWLKEPITAIEYATSMLQQVRLEMFVTKDFKIKLNSLHFESFQAAPIFNLRNWDIERNTLKIVIDDRNNFNRVKGAYSFLPDKNEEGFFSRIYRNDAAIATTRQTISKQLSFPNLYIESDVENQLQEILRMASSYFEIIEANFTYRSLLKEPGDFVLLNVSIGRATFDAVPCMIRSVTYEPKGLKVTMKLWSLQMMPFPGYNPGYAGTTGGYNAALTVE